LIPYPEALAIVRDNIRPLPSESVPVEKALGRYLARPVKAPAHSPRFEQSAMDGYAVRMADVKRARPNRSVLLNLADELPAGDQRSVRLKPGQTVKVFTGSRLPSGADAVVMKEFVTLKDGRAAIAQKVSPGDHIRRVGEEYRRGDIILPASTRVTPPVIGMLIMLSKDSVAVRRRPSVTVITMGDELVAPGIKLGPGQVHDSNGPAVVAALKSLGVVKVRHRRVKDRLASLVRAMKDGLEKTDLVVTVGGASVGDYDFVPEARRELGVRDLFTKVAIKPGKPNLFGLDRRQRPVFGLPGNTVSALVSFHQLVKPAVLQMMGAVECGSATLPVHLDAGVRRNPSRLNLMRGRMTHDSDRIIASLLTGQGSHMLSGLALADVLVEIPSGSTRAKAGEGVRAVKLDWEK
jgi:molybdopterin molybdotransferase